MLDPRFYVTHAPLSLDDIADLTGGVRQGGERNSFVAFVDALANPAPGGAIVFVMDQRKLTELEESAAVAAFVPHTLRNKIPPTARHMAVFLVEDAKLAFARTAARLHQSKPVVAVETRISASAQIAPDVRIAKTATIGEGACIGGGCVIGPGALIGTGVLLGEKCHIAANVTVTHTMMGTNCYIGSGSVIGDAGFGYVPSDNGMVQVPQLGRVVLGDDIDIGANCTIDRGTIGDTFIGTGTKIDNMVHIAHNSLIEKNCLIAAQVGMSGSVHLEEGVMVGGQAGFAEHKSVGANALILARSGVTKDVPAGERWSGFPAKPVHQWLREQASLAKISHKK